MLEQLFGSKTRVRLLRLFLNDPKGAYFVRQLTRKIEAQINAVRNELDNLLVMGIVVATNTPKGVDGVVDTKQSAQQRKYYRLNTDALLYPELRALFFKSRVLIEKDFIKRMTQNSTISYMALTGFFVGQEGAPTDLFIVGRVNHGQCAALIKSFERDLGRELNYTIMTPQEYKYRRDVTDKFLYSILESEKIVVVDLVAEKAEAAA